MTEIQLNTVRTFGSKELTEGCKVKAEMFGRDEYFTCIGMRRITEGVGIYQYDKFEQDGVPIEILGHIPHLFPDVARVAKEKGLAITATDGFGGLLGLDSKTIPYNPTLDLIDQDEQLTLIPLLSLIK